MNYQLVTKQSVKSDLGFVVALTGRFTGEYRAKGRAMVFDVDHGANGTLSIRTPETWDGISTKITTEDRRECILNLNDALSLLMRRVLNPHL